MNTRSSRYTSAIRSVIVYGLMASDGYMVQYIGQTKLGLDRRLARHIAAARRAPRQPVEWWVRSVLRRGCSVRAVVLEHDAEWDEAEIRHIAFHKELGGKLLNVASGGRGCPGFSPSEETRRKRSESVRADWAMRTDRCRWVPTDEQRLRHAESCKRRGQGSHWVGSKHREDSRAKMRETWIARKGTPQELARRQKIADAQKRRWSAAKG